YELDAGIKLDRPIEDNILLTDNSFSSENILSLNTFADSTEIDTILNQDTTLVLEDTTFVDSTAFDSTARLKYFRYQREDVPYVRLKEKKPSSFFVQPSPTNKSRTIEIDSTGQFVIVKETIAGQE